MDVNETEFQVLKNFTQQVIQDQPIGRAGVRVGVITYGHPPNITIDRFELDRHFDAGDALAGVDEIPYDPTGVDGYLGAAIDRMVDAFAGDFGARSFAPHVGVLLTKGLSSCDDQARAARRAMDANIILRIIVVTPTTVTCMRRKRTSAACQKDVCTFIGSFSPQLIPKTELFSSLTMGSAAEDLVEDILSCSECACFCEHAYTHTHAASPGFFSIPLAYDCGLLTIGNGTVQYSDGTTVGSTATFLCHFGFTLSMDVAATCTASVGWNATVPTCKGRLNSLQHKQCHTTPCYPTPHYSITHTCTHTPLPSLTHTHTLPHHHQLGRSVSCIVTASGASPVATVLVHVSIYGSHTYCTCLACH